MHLLRYSNAKVSFVLPAIAGLSIKQQLSYCWLAAPVMQHTVWCMQISGVVYMFRFPPQTALAVGLSMAQIGEFAFVLLSVASQLGLMPYQVYMLLMGKWLLPPLVILSSCSCLSIGVTVMLQSPS